MKNAPPPHPAQFSGHETFPLRQMWLKKAFDAATEFDSAAPKSIFSDEEAIVRFGVGRNMVTAIRHWALACEVIEDRDGSFRVTEFGRRVLSDGGLDPYGEHPSSAWLAHWLLAGKGNRATTWYWVFNNISGTTIDQNRLLSEIKEYAVDNGHRLSDKTITQDIACFFRSYVPQMSGSTPEELSEPVLGELGLIHPTLKGGFEFRRGQKKTLNNGMFAYAVVDYWNRLYQNVSTLSFNSVAHDFGSPGRVFKLDENSVAERLSVIADCTDGQIVWSDTAGMRQLLRNGDVDLNGLLEACYE